LRFDVTILQQLSDDPPQKAAARWRSSIVTKITAFAAPFFFGAIARRKSIYGLMDLGFAEFGNAVRKP
jgi:hypothetical protein